VVGYEYKILIEEIEEDLKRVKELLNLESEKNG